MPRKTRTPKIKADRARREQYRYGIGEWYGRSFLHLTPAERRAYAELQQLRKRDRPEQPCPFRSTLERTLPCTKEGGVCSLRLYHRLGPDEIVSAASGRSKLCTTCPNRFLQNQTVFEWIGNVMLDTPTPLVVPEVRFLERPPSLDEEETKSRRHDVGHIDHVLVHPTANPMNWCALEIQAVYFSGASMGTEFKMLREHRKEELPFPASIRRPDFRSSGPKRLMPQLQIKVPSLRRWGKKMAVVVDESFYSALGSMDAVKEVSNCDIAWFIVSYEESADKVQLKPKNVRFTTLERSVEGLTGGVPVSLPVFEQRIKEKLSKRASQRASLDLSQ